MKTPNFTVPSDCPRFAAEVKRYSTWPVTQTQTNSQHTYHVMRIYISVFGHPDEETLNLLMYHDGGEIRAGDIPFPTKSLNPELKKAHKKIETEVIADVYGLSLTTDSLQNWRLKICDLIEMWEFGLTELHMGNRLGRLIVTRTSDAVVSMLDSAHPDENADNIARVKEYMKAVNERVDL